MMRSAVLISIVAALSIALFLIFHWDLMFTLSITFCITDYHILMRLLVGKFYDNLMHNHVNYRKWWFREHSWEKKFYKVLNVKKWKSKVPTYDANAFAPSKHSWDEIVQATCQSELVHETIMVFSLLPILCTRWVGSFPAFLTTSVIAMLIDSVFVILQRYNRPRILKILNRKSS